MACHKLQGKELYQLNYITFDRLHGKTSCYMILGGCGGLVLGTMYPNLYLLVIV